MREPKLSLGPDLVKLVTKIDVFKGGLESFDTMLARSDLRNILLQIIAVCAI